MIKAIFFDIDGTLISFRTHEMPVSTLKALKELKEKGVKIFIATGRSEMLVDNIDKAFFDGILTVNGQYVRDNDSVIYKNPIPGPDVRAAIEYAGQTGISCLFEGADFLVINSINANAAESARMLDLPLPAPGDIRSVADREVIQLIFYGTQREEKELLARMPSCTSTRWSPLLADIIPRGGGKHVGLQKTLEHYGFRREESMAFGDGENDSGMLEYAAIGVAMGNAAEEVKAVADFVTRPVDDDGIEFALRHFGLI